MRLDAFGRGKLAVAAFIIKNGSFFLDAGSISVMSLVPVNLAPLVWMTSLVGFCHVAHQEVKCLFILIWHK